MFEEVLATLTAGGGGAPAIHRTIAETTPIVRQILASVFPEMTENQLDLT